MPCTWVLDSVVHGVNKKPCLVQKEFTKEFSVHSWLSSQVGNAHTGAPTVYTCHRHFRRKSEAAIRGAHLAILGLGRVFGMRLSCPGVWGHAKGDVSELPSLTIWGLWQGAWTRPTVAWPSSPLGRQLGSEGGVPRWH
jgi:hypothetical protein